MAVTGKLKIGETIAFTEEGKDAPTLGIVTYDPDGEVEAVFVMTTLSNERQVTRASITERINLSDLEKSLNRRALGSRGKTDSIARSELDKVHRLRQVQKIAPAAHAAHIKSRQSAASTDSAPSPDAPALTDTAPLTEGSAVPAPVQEAPETQA